MKQPTKDRPRAVLANGKYESVTSMMQGQGIPKNVQSKFAHLISESHIATQMAQLRHRAGITQKQMADALGITQSAISKLEAGRDNDITLNQIKEYARITGDRINLLFGKPFSHSEAVKLHADGLKYRLEKLADIASQNEEFQTEIKVFIGDAFYKLFNIVTLINNKLPVKENDCVEEIRMEIITGKTVPTTVAPLAKASCKKEELVTV